MLLLLVDGHTVVCIPGPYFVGCGVVVIGVAILEGVFISHCFLAVVPRGGGVSGAVVPVWWFLLRWPKSGPHFIVRVLDLLVMAMSVVSLNGSVRTRGPPSSVLVKTGR